MAAESLLPLLTTLGEDLESDTRLCALAGRVGASPFQFHRRFAAELGAVPRRAAPLRPARNVKRAPAPPRYRAAS